MRYLKFLSRLAAVLLFSIIILAAPAAATQLAVYPGGTKDVSVPVDQYINIFVSGSQAVEVFKSTGGPSSNTPVRYVLETSGRFSNGETAFGPYTAATTIRIKNPGPDVVYYSVGKLAAILPVLRHTPRAVYTQLDPVAQNATATLLAPTLMKGLITSTQATGATITLTLPTGALLDAASGLQINQGFEWTLINASAAAADTVTIAAGTGHTVVGTMIIQSAHASTGLLYGNAVRFFTRKTAADTFITYRIGG